MRLLLDTHALIWWLTDKRRLSPAARAAIADPDNLVMASAASGYEIANKQRLGRLSGRIAQDLPNALREARIPVHGLRSRKPSPLACCLARIATLGAG
jgi:PIN domain nuclease of toxin-antitoxin system